MIQRLTIFGENIFTVTVTENITRYLGKGTMTKKSGLTISQSHLPKISV